MTLRRFIAASALTAGLGAAGFSMAVGVANAQPGQPGQPNQPGCSQPAHCQEINGKQLRDRGVDDARRDHQPFLRDGQRVQPMMSGDNRGWGYWFNGIWNWL